MLRIVISLQRVPLCSIMSLENDVQDCSFKLKVIDKWTYLSLVVPARLKKSRPVGKVLRGYKSFLGDAVADDFLVASLQPFIGPFMLHLLGWTERSRKTNLQQMLHQHLGSPNETEGS